MAEVGRFPHLAEFRKGVHHIYFFKLIQAPQVIPVGLFLFHRRYMDYLSEKSLSFRKFSPLDFQSSIVPVLDEKLQPIM